MALRTFLRNACAALALTFAAGAMCPPVALAAGGDIKVIVNKVPITSLDVQRRTAFLKLQRRKGGLAAMALEELIDEQLKRVEMRRVGITIHCTATSISAYEVAIVI